MQLEELLDNKGDLSKVAIERAFSLQENLGVPIEQWRTKEWEQCVINEAFNTRSLFRNWRSKMRTMLKKLDYPETITALESVEYDDVWAFREKNTDAVKYVGNIEELLDKFKRADIDFNVGKFSFICSAYILFWYGFTMDDVRVVKKADLKESEIKRERDGEIIKLDPKAYDMLREFKQQTVTVSFEFNASPREYAMSEFLFRKCSIPRPKVPHYETETKFRKFLQEFVCQCKRLEDLEYENVYDSGYFYRVNDAVCNIKLNATVKHITQLLEFRELFDEYREIRGKKVRNTNVYREIYRRFVTWHNLYYNDKITD